MSRDINMWLGQILEEEAIRQQEMQVYEQVKELKKQVEYNMEQELAYLHGTIMDKNAKLDALEFATVEYAEISQTLIELRHKNVYEFGRLVAENNSVLLLFVEDIIYEI